MRILHCIRRIPGPHSQISSKKEESRVIICLSPPTIRSSSTMVHNLYYNPLSSIIRKQLNESNDPPRDEEIDDSNEKREYHRWSISGSSDTNCLESRITASHRVWKSTKNPSFFRAKNYSSAFESSPCLIGTWRYSVGRSYKKRLFEWFPNTVQRLHPLPKGAAAVYQLLSTLNAQYYVC